MAKDIAPEMQVLGKTPSGLYIVTAENDGTRVGFLASWVQQCGFMPPAISVAIKQDRPIMRQLSRGAKFAVNLLGTDDKAIMGKFAKGFEMDEDPFEGSNVQRTEDGTPYLADALGYMECTLMRVLE
ncbi:MAG: flavin reductase family protein, partial [Planctomycetota bacterium]